MYSASGFIVNKLYIWFLGNCLVLGEQLDPTRNSWSKVRNTAMTVFHLFL